MLPVHWEPTSIRASFGNSATLPEPSIAFDADGNGSGKQAAQDLSRRLREPGSTARLATLPDGQERELTGPTINQRVGIVDRALRIAFPGAPGQVAPALQTNYWQRAHMGIGKPRPALSRLRVKIPKRAIVPLSVDEVARFWSSFRNSRDLAIVGLMLLQGLRSQEVLDLRRGVLLLSQSQTQVRGKSNKTRFLPPPPHASEPPYHHVPLRPPHT